MPGTTDQRRCRRGLQDAERLRTVDRNDQSRSEWESSVDETPNWNALARMLVIRIMRVPAVPGASIGTPVQAIVFTPAWIPWKML